MKLSVNINAESAGNAHAESADNRTISEVEELGFTTENAEDTEDFINTARCILLSVLSQFPPPSVPSVVKWASVHKGTFFMQH